MKKRILSLFLCLTIISSVFFAIPTMEASAATQLTSSQIETVISWALANKGNTSYAYLCQKFVADAYAQVATRQSKATAKDAANAWCTHPGDKNPPRGATVYYDWYGTVDGVYKNYGHVGIALGDGRVVHAYGNKGVVVSPNVDFMTGYIGWGVNGGFILPEDSNYTADPIHSSTAATIRNGFFTVKNVASGTYLNVWGGSDANDVPVTTYSYDDSTDQQFNFVHQGNGKYKIYPYCSSNGTNRVVDILRYNAAITEGQKVDIYNPNDDTAQLFYIVPLSDGSYVFEIASKDGYVIAPPSGYAGSDSKDSQLTVQKYTGASHQKWKFCNNNGGETHPIGDYSADTYKVNTNGVNLTMRNGAGTGYLKVTSVPDNTLLNVSKVSGNWGYTSYNGYSGWVCLDFCIYAPTITSISVHTEPYNTEFFVGEIFDSIGLEIKVAYSNGSSKIVANGFTISVDISSPGIKTVTVAYEGKTTSFNVNVKDIEISLIEIISSATKTSYYVGDTLDTTNLSLLATYNNGSTKNITSGFTTNYDFGTVGTKTVTVSYEGLSVTYDVTVENIGSATLSSSLTSTAVKGDEITYVVDLKSAEGVYDGNYNIVYDKSVLKYKSHAVGATLTGQNYVVNPEYSENSIRITFAGTSALKTGNMLSITFEVVTDAETTTQVKFQNVNMYNQNGKAVSVSDSGLTENCSISKRVQDKASEIIVNQNNDFNIMLKSKSQISGILIVAWYDNNNCLLKVKSYPATESITVPTENVASAKCVRFMWWNSLDDLKPFTESKKLSIN